MKNWVRFLLLCLFCPQLWGQVNVTATIVDTDGQAWINGNYAVSLVLPPGVTKYYDKNTGLPFTDTFQRGLDGTGSLSLTLIPTGQISPAGTTWKFIICPQVLGAGCGDTAFPVNGTGSLSAQLNAVIPVPRVTGGPGVYAYNDMEVAAFAPNTYFNVISQKNRCYQTSWDVCGSGTGGATLPTNAIVFGLSPLTSRAAIPGQDFLSPSITNGMVPLGIATPGVNQASNIFQFQSNYCTNSTPCNPAVDTLSIQSVPVNNSQNPLMQMIFGHSGSPGGAVGLFQFPVSLPTGSTAVTQAPGDTSTDIANDAFVAAAVAAATGNPGGADTYVQVNHLGEFAGYPGFTYDNSTQTMAIGPLGTANSGANFNSGILSVCGSYFNVTPLAACFTIQDTVTTGTTPYSVIQFGFNSPGGGQFNMPFTNFLDGFTQQGFNSGAVVFQATPTSGNYQIFWPPQNPVGGSTFLSCSPIDSSHCQGDWVAGGGGAGAVTPQSFGGFGDAVSVANGCTTNGTTTVVCPAGPFVVGDVGKEIDIWGAGAAGVSFKANISTYVSNTTVTVSATPATNVTQNPAVFGHDDAAAIQSCWNASSVNGVQCIMGTATPSSFLTPAGYLVSSAGLTIPTHANITGNSFYEGTTMFGEFNGDFVSLPTSTSSVGAGQPIVGVNFANLELYMDPTLANGRGIHLNAAGGVFGPGGMYASTFSNVMVENSAKECLWMDGSTSGADLPNQVLTFNMLYCNLPNQMHTAAAINITGSTAQIIFENGQINGSTTHSNEPNPLISLTGSGGKFPVDVKFIGYTCEVATTCLYFGPNTSNIHYDNGYMEQVDNALIADTSAQGFTFNGNYLPNVGNDGSGGGAVAQFLGGATGAMRDNTTVGATPTVWATCSGATNVVLQSGNHSSNLQTSGCALSIAVSGGTQNANSCSADTNITMPGITTDSLIIIGYGAASEAGVAGWGTTGGMKIVGRPSATSTMSWHLCNPTGSNITYGAYTFKWGFLQQ